MILRRSLWGPVLSLGTTMSLTSAFAGGFESANARVVVAGQDCKKASVSIHDGQIEVDCKAGGYVRKISELTDLRWTRDGNWATLTANEADGSVFSLTVTKTEFPLLKDTMKSMMADGAPADEAAAPAAPSTTTTVSTVTTSAAPAQVK